ncbi:hypothetical protein ASG40_13030 [Methylobacterium sp. Leaf399]|uniref:hypothetical protein n=1 Tax=Methylobacterium sp. Leaf399 TaxID=1736364 RepID=UPI0006FD9285|nr:hypothetical protein [Methylobacterium sp. Leaf399]KQT07825.1 hypothetical protein ASG40_13030 [Methylobacterium sp. Leaf399]
MTDEMRAAILATAGRIGASPLDLGTTISYETGGTFDPWKKGPTTQWGEHRGLIQWGEPQRQKYGVTQDMPVAAQVEAAGNYLVDAGFKPGMGLIDLYSAVNAGRVGRYNASDANNGGAPGTVADKVNNQMSGHQAKAAAFLGGEFVAAMPDAAKGGIGRAGFGLSGPVASDTAIEPSMPALEAAAPAPERPDDTDYAGILKGLLATQVGAPAAPAQAAPAPITASPPRRTAFDASKFFGLLPTARR